MGFRGDAEHLEQLFVDLVELNFPIGIMDHEIREADCRGEHHEIVWSPFGAMVITDRGNERNGEIPFFGERGSDFRMIDAGKQ